MLKESSVVAKSKSVKCTQLPDGEAVLLSLETKYFYTLNRDAFSIWDRLNGKSKAGEIASAIASQRCLEKSQALEIVLKQISELMREKLAEVLR